MRASITEAATTSKDGTRIHYTQVGDGPGLVLVHGAMQIGRNFEKLASALSSSYRVVCYDRRGRQQNAAGGINSDPDRITREADDLKALIAATDSTCVFGLSSGAILTMAVVLEAPSIEKVILYEPPITMGGVDPGDWSGEFLDALSRERFGTAMAILLKGTGDRELLSSVPRPLLSGLFGLLIRVGGPAPNGVLLRELLLTVPADIAIQRAAFQTLSPFSRFVKPTLLLGGKLSNTKLTLVLDSLERELPNASRTLIQASGHIAADNEGKPDEVARAIDSFLRTKKE
jgi:pimeloyl-ACP methyl ester carboxylesterase